MPKFDTLIVNLEQVNLQCDDAILLVKDSETGRINYLDSQKDINNINSQKKIRKPCKIIKR